MAHLSPSHWWKSISPCVVLAWKLGAVLPNRSRGCSPAGVARQRRKRGVAGCERKRCRRRTGVKADEKRRGVVDGMMDAIVTG